MLYATQYYVARERSPVVVDVIVSNSVVVVVVVGASAIALR